MSGAATISTLLPAPGRVGRLLAVVRKLIDYGKELAASLREATRTPDSQARCFGTHDLALILARIARGLQLALALERRIVTNAARLDVAPGRRGGPSPPGQRALSPAAPVVRRAGDCLPLVPTPEQIAAEVRRRPIGAVIADICRDLGLPPSNRLWLEVSLAIGRHGGSVVTLLNDMFDRMLPLSPRQSDGPSSNPAPLLPTLLCAGTGRPP